MPRPPDPLLTPERALDNFERAKLDSYILDLRQHADRHARYVDECADILNKLVEQSKKSPTGRAIGAGGFWAGVGWSAWTLDIIGVGLGAAIAFAGSLADKLDRARKERLREPERRHLLEAVEALRRIESGIAAAERACARKGWSPP